MLKKRLVLLGGGHTHAVLINKLAMRPLEDVEVILVSPHRFSPYSGMLSGYLTGVYSYEAMHVDLLALCFKARVRLILAKASALDPQRKEVHFAEGSIPVLTYDVLSINIGSQPERGEYGLAVKPMENFLGNLEALSQKKSLAIIGGGIGGVELALSLNERFGEALDVALIERGDALLPGSSKRLSGMLAKHCGKRGIRVHLNAADPQSLVRDYEEYIWATHAKGPDLFRQTGFQVDDRGFALTEDTLLCMGQSHIFAAGDCAVICGQERPRAGVFAVRLAKPLFDNIERLFRHKPLQSVRLQKHNLALLRMGPDDALAIRGSCYWRSSWLWRLKSAIDLQFMAQFTSRSSASESVQQAS